MAQSMHSSGCSHLEHPTDDRREPPIQSFPPIGSSTDAPGLGESAGHLCPSDQQVKHLALSELQQLLERALACPMSSPCRKLLLRAELRALFLLLHLGYGQLKSPELRQCLFRSKYLEKLLHQ